MQPLFIGIRHGTLFRHIDSVKELTQILLADVGALLDLCRRETNIRDVVSAELNLILHLSSSDILYTIKELHLAHPLFTQEIANLHDITSERDIDREMRIYEPHLVAEAACDAHDHVVDVRAYRADASQLLSISEPEVDTNRLVSDFAHVPH